MPQARLPAPGASRTKWDFWMPKTPKGPRISKIPLKGKTSNSKQKLVMLLYKTCTPVWCTFGVVMPYQVPRSITMCYFTNDKNQRRHKEAAAFCAATVMLGRQVYGAHRVAYEAFQISKRSPHEKWHTCRDNTRSSLQVHIWNFHHFCKSFVLHIHSQNVTRATVQDSTSIKSCTWNRELCVTLFNGP